MLDPKSIPALFDLTGKIACITGASSGLGRRSALVLAAAGAKVVCVARRREALLELQASMPNQCAVVDHDLVDRTGLKSLSKKVAEPYGDPDIIVHAAGINTREPADDITPEGWDTTLDLNLRAPFFLSQYLVPAMQAKGWGRIINFASLQSYRAFSGGLSYGASKGGVAQMTRAMAQAWSAQGINAELTAAVFADPERSALNAQQTCIGRNGELEDIDGTVLFLASRASDYVTGQVLMVDGGFTAK